MQICKEGIHVSVAGGTKLNDGEWHTVSFQPFLDVASLLKLVANVQHLRLKTIKSGVWITRAPGVTQLEVSSQGRFVVLEADGSNKLVVGLQPKEPEGVLSGELRLALGGVLIDEEHMMVQVGLF